MGLDMYAFTVRPEVVGDNLVDIEVSDETPHDQLHYWRKHPNLHGWMERLYRARGSAAEVFNCVAMVLLPADIDALERDVLANKLPSTSGFFFGTSDDHDQQDDLDFIFKARRAQSEGWVVLYSSWW